MTRHLKWIASYPKSGNTWLRYLAYILEFNALPVNSKQVDIFANSRIENAEIDSTTYIKTHARVDVIGRWAERTSRAVYVYRHPLDALCSALNYELLVGSNEYSNLPLELQAQWKADFIHQYIENAGTPAWIAGDRQYGTWIANVTGWVFGDVPFPIKRIRYEDMLTSPRSIVEDLATFLEIDASPDAIDLAVNGTRFDAMQSMEKAEIAEANALGRSLGRFSSEARRGSSARGLRFFNKGKAGAYTEILTPEQIDRAWAVFGPLATRLEYTV